MKVVVEEIKNYKTQDFEGISIMGVCSTSSDVSRTLWAPGVLGKVAPVSAICTL
jgi:hypothetical protein